MSKNLCFELLQTYPREFCSTCLEIGKISEETAGVSLLQLVRWLAAAKAWLGTFQRPTPVAPNSDVPFMYFGPAAAEQRACTLLCIWPRGHSLSLSAAAACNMFNSAACTHQINCTDHQSRAPMAFFLARLPFIQHIYIYNYRALGFLPFVFHRRSAELLLICFAETPRSFPGN